MTLEFIFKPEWRVFGAKIEFYDIQVDLYCVQKFSNVASGLEQKLIKIPKGT